MKSEKNDENVLKGKESGKKGDIEREIGEENEGRENALTTEYERGKKGR
jgi:hypothetical protein